MSLERIFKNLRTMRFRTMTRRDALLQTGILFFLLTGVLLTPPTRPAAPALEPYVFQENSHGLLGTYFDTTDPLSSDSSHIFRRRIDPRIDFNWPGLPPGAVVWTGRYLIDQTGELTFTLLSHDGVRLWLDRELRIDDWERRGAGKSSRFIGMGQGWHSLRLDYRHFDNNASVRLTWTPPHGTPTLIPADHLAPTNLFSVKTDPVSPPRIFSSPLRELAAFLFALTFLSVTRGRGALILLGLCAGLAFSEVMLHWIPE